MATTITFYLQQNVSGTVNVLTGTWAGIVNNSSAAAFKSTAASDANGKVTINSVTPGSYTSYTSPDGVSLPPGGTWTSTGDANFTVNETDSSNDTTIPGRLILTTASAKILSGATRIDIKNSADNKVQVGIPDSGVITFRNAIEVPPAQDTAIPTHTYGTVPVLLDAKSGSSDANTTLTIPSGGPFSTLVVHWTGRSDQGSAQAMTMQLNGDTGNNYDLQFYQDINATITAAAPTIAGPSMRVGVVSASGAVAGAVSNAVITLQNADSTTLRKIVQYTLGSWDSDAAAGARFEQGQGQWRNTANAITSIKLFPSTGNLVNWRARVYGWP